MDVRRLLPEERADRLLALPVYCRHIVADALQLAGSGVTRELSPDDVRAQSGGLLGHLAQQPELALVGMSRSGHVTEILLQLSARR